MLTSFGSYDHKNDLSLNPIGERTIRSPMEASAAESIFWHGVGDINSFVRRTDYSLHVGPWPPSLEWERVAVVTGGNVDGDIGMYGTERKEFSIENFRERSKDATFTL